MTSTLGLLAGGDEMPTVRELEQQHIRLNAAVQALQQTVVKVDTQVKRIISDIESEKGTRQRQDERLEQKLDQMQTDITTAMDKNSEKREAQMQALSSKQEETNGLVQKFIWIGVGVSVILAPFASKLVDMISKLVGLE